MKGRAEPTPESFGASTATTRALADIHVDNNAQSAGAWDLYADHRQKLTELVAAHGPRRRVAILGAGNCNDLDLAALAKSFEEVHLADLDPAALVRALRRQTTRTRRRLFTHAGHDLSGLVTRLPRWRRRAPDLETLARAAPAAAAQVVAQLPGPFDVVVSDCFLSQIAWTCFRALGEGPLLEAVLDVAVAAHLRTLVALTRPGGRCLLVTDVVSSESQPLERLLPHADPGAVLRDLDRRSELFSGTSPSLAHVMLTADPDLAREVEDVSVISPWLWDVSPRRKVLVCALAFGRRRVVTGPSS
ncbi:MAG TPA: hypothetical protein VLA14_00565 [Polyangia bacterium]|nr:hypothetical protein [Polyangia bacterium]